MSTDQHKKEAEDARVTVSVLVASSTRLLDTDTSGVLLVEKLEAAGYRAVERAIVDDRIPDIRQAVLDRVATRVGAIVLTGGTGIASKDVTPDAVEPLFERALPGFGEMFRWLSHAEIGSATILSRATAGIIQKTVVFCVPGSRAACRLAVDELIGPELKHIAHHLES